LSTLRIYHCQQHAGQSVGNRNLGLFGSGLFVFARQRLRTRSSVLCVSRSTGGTIFIRITRGESRRALQARERLWNVI